MSTIRSEMVKKAKRKGLCTSCFLYPATKRRVQCQRCIDTNTAKQNRRREEKGMSAGQIVNAFCRRKNICVRCHCRYTEGFNACEKCLANKRKRNTGSSERVGSGIRKKKPTNAKIREYQNKYKHKKLVEKVRKLDRIKHAVDKA